MPPTAGITGIITLGTGFGTALFEDGRSLPHLELAHHPFRKGKTYEQLLGKKALEKGRREKVEPQARAGDPHAPEACPL